jgi:myo-inositol-1(or 4)-monophosphatase
MDRQHLLQRYYAIAGLAQEAGVLAMGYFQKRESLGISMKGAQDWLTVADGKVESFLREKLAALFPDDAVIGEEGGGKAAHHVWIIDPIDGTANFAHGDRNWCISIGFVVDRRPMVGVIHAPALDETYLALRSGGATLNGEAIKASETDTMKRASVEMGWSTRRPLDEYLGMVRRGFEAGGAIRRSASGALGLAHVACGRTDGYAESHINAWDVAAGIVIAEEAGAVVNDFFAGDGIARGNPILCAAPKLAGELSGITGIPLSL